jgi:hemolysin activation/secretion protein
MGLIVDMKKSFAVICATIAPVFAGSAVAQISPESTAILAGQPITQQPIGSNDPSAEIGIPVPSSAQGESVIAAASDTLIGAINIDGASKIPSSAFSDVVEQYLGKSASSESLQSLARSIADLARQRGYIFATAMVPEQVIRLGIVRVQLDEGSIDQVRVIGPTNRRLNVLLGKLVGQAPDRAHFERYLLLAGDIPGIRITRTRFEREQGRGILIVEASEDRASGQLWVDNYGSEAFGPVRARVHTELNSIAVAGDTLSTMFMATPINSKELAFASLRYAMPIGTNGLTASLSLAAGKTQLIDRGSGTVIEGKSKYAALGANYPLLRSNDKSVWLSGEIAYLSVDQHALGSLIQSDTIVTASVTLTGQIRIGKSRLSGGIGTTQGLDLFGATGAFDPLASRLDGRGVFTKAYSWLQWVAPLPQHFSLRVSASAQLASRSLLAAQELSLGGPSFGRGFNFSERFGDTGILGLVELRRDFDQPIPWVKWAQLYGFVDGGYVHNFDAGFGSGTLLSAGAGVRAGLGPAEFALEAAAPLNSIRAESGNKKPRINMSVGYKF